MVKLALLWHMHQPHYEDLATGEHVLPWVRLHATKDYWGMVALTTEFPNLRVTFNLVPSLLVQLEAFAEQRANDRHLSIGLKPADFLTADDRSFLLANGFHASVPRAIRPNPRYAELNDKRANPWSFTVGDLRDLQVWMKLVWMDPDWQRTDARLKRLIAQGRAFTEEDKQILREVELELLRAVIPTYRAAARSGRVELSTSPFYHPILPLLCDSDTHFRAHPHSALPRQLFRRPEDARAQLTRAFELHERMFGERPAGVWPSEGAVSDEVVALLRDQRARWTATDEEILARSLGRRLHADDLYRSYAASPEKDGVRLVFRDHQLSDLIGFTYQSWDTDAAVADFLGRLRDAGRRFQETNGGGDALVAIILDGENAWEHYPDGGRPFLRALYRALEDAGDITTVTMSQATAQIGRSLPSLFPGSWINGDYCIWAGHADDHRAWSQLAAARRIFDQRGGHVAPDARARAYEELLIAEGSDWFWWYGDDHSSDHDAEFDELFRRHVRNVYRALGEPEPDELHVTNITTATAAGPLRLGILSRPASDGRSTNFASWASAVQVPLGSGGGTMHRVSGYLIQAVRVAVDLDALHLRLEGPELVRRVVAGEATVAVLAHRPHALKVAPPVAVVDIVTLSIPFTRLQVTAGERVGLSVLVIDAAGHVLEQHPPTQPFEIDVPTADHDAIHWLV